MVSVTADYGGTGPNVGNFNRVYTVAANVSVPIYSGGRIRAEVEQAQADLTQRPGSGGSGFLEMTCAGVGLGKTTKYATGQISWSSKS